jgi:hypothetical protein
MEMISAEFEMEMPENCEKCRFKCVKRGEWYCVMSERYLSDEQLAKRPYWCKLQPNIIRGRMLHWKGELCDGHVHMTAKEFLHHRSRVNVEKQRMKLKKLANNPAFAEDVRETLYRQIFYLNLLELHESLYEKEVNKNNE